MKILSVFILTLLPLANFASAQSNINIDSLKNLLHKDISNRDKLLANVDIAHYYVYHSLDSAELYLRKFFGNKTFALEVPQNYYKHYLIKSWVHQGNGQLDHAKKALQQAIQLAKGAERKSILELKTNLGSLYIQTRDPDALAYAQEIIESTDTTQSREDKSNWLWGSYYEARAYGNEENYNLALSKLVSLLKVSFSSDFPRQVGGILNSIAVYSQENGDVDIALQYLREALQSPLSTLHDKNDLLLNIADLKLRKQEIDSAKTYVVQVDVDYNDEQCQLARRILSRIAIRQGKYEDSLEQIALAKECAEVIKDTLVDINILLLESETYRQLKQLTTSERIINQIDDLLTNYSKSVDDEIKLSLSQLKLAIHLAQKQPDLATTFTNYQKLQTEKTQRMADKSLKAVVIAYEAEKKEQENQLLKTQNELQQTQLNRRQINLLLLVAVLIAFIAAILLLVYRNRYYRERNLVLSQQKQLVEQEKQRVQLENKQLGQENETLGNELDTTKLEKEELAVSLAEKEKRLQDPHEIAKHAIPYKKGGKTTQIVLADLAYIEADSNYVQLNLTNGQVLRDRASLASYERRLPNEIFLRIHKGFIINMLHIKLETNTEFVLSITDAAGVPITLPIGPKLKEETKVAYHDFCNSLSQ